MVLDREAVGLVANALQAQAWFPDIWNLIQHEYEVVRVFPGTLGDGQVVVCRRRGNGVG